MPVAVVVFMFCAVSPLILSMAAESDLTMDVCEAVRLERSEVAEIRGTGARSRVGTFLFDFTCSLGTGNDFTLPAGIMIESPTFSTQAISEEFRDVKKPSLFQARVKGKLECRSPFIIYYSDDGDIGGANGFGPIGLYPCRLLNPEILYFHKIKHE